MGCSFLLTPVFRSLPVAVRASILTCHGIPVVDELGARFFRHPGHARHASVRHSTPIRIGI
jgi:hypothetical protein